MLTKSNIYESRLSTTNPSVMNLERLFQVLDAMHPLSQALKEALQNELASLSLPKDHLLLEAPKIADYAFFIESGFAISYTFARGRRQIERLFGPGQIVLSPRSLFERTPSHEFIQLMQAGHVLHISYESLMQILNTFPDANIIYRTVMNQYHEQWRERFHDHLTLKAPARYEKLHREFPGIEQLLPQEYLASYLGITPQSLSRLKKIRGRS